MMNLQGEEQHNYFEYIPRGMMDGDVVVPEDTCGVCGRTMYQPYPTGIWEHLDPMENDHCPRKANTVERLLILNLQENRRKWTELQYYGDDKPVKRNHEDCLIHKKYWGLTLGKTEKQLDRLVGVGGFEENGRFLNFSERKNVLRFKKFTSSYKKEYLNKNPPMPTVILRFLRVKRHQLEFLYEIKNAKAKDLPNIGDKIKIARKRYVVTSISQPHHRNARYDEQHVWLKSA